MSKLKENDKQLKPLDKNTKKIIPSDHKIKQNTSKMRLSLPQITPTTEKLQNKIFHFKSQHAQLTKTLENAILNNNLYRTLSASQLKNLDHVQFLDKRHARKQKSLSNLQKKMKNRIQLNQEAENQLQKMQDEVKTKKLTVAKRLSEIQARNLEKIQEIQDFEKEFLEKVKLELSRNMQKEKKLKKEFEKIKNQNAKLSKVKEFESKLDNDGWKLIMQEKINLESLMQSQKEKQLRLIKQKNVEIGKKQQKTVNTNNEEKKVGRQRVKVDMKEAGREYLDFAKKKGSNGPKQSKQMRKNYLNVNLKVINYDNDMLERIGNNDGLLSMVGQKNAQPQENSAQKDAKMQNATKKVIQNLHQFDIVPILQQQQEDSENSEFSDIQQTANIVQKIKQNIQEIEQRYQKNAKPTH